VRQAAQPLREFSHKIAAKTRDEKCSGPRGVNAEQQHVRFFKMLCGLAEGLLATYPRIQRQGELVAGYKSTQPGRLAWAFQIRQTLRIFLPGVRTS
jgi:hypothetical protein